MSNAPIPPATTTAHETHLSRLFFTPDRVYKQLKAVTLPFVDFSDTEARCAAAAEEYERNRAISPDVYLGLADIHEDGELVDRMIVMRRLRQEDALPNLLHRGDASEQVEDAARYIAALHARLDPLRGDAAAPASFDAISRNWSDNFDAIEPAVGELIDAGHFDEVRSMAETYLAGRSELFQNRIADGWVRDGHGDLRAEHIYCTDDGIRIIDCVAFDERLRIADVLADVAFFAMDLDRLVGPSGATELMRAWTEHTNESHPSSLAHFYVAYRAHVRCKIACLRYAQGYLGAAQVAQRYHEQARRHLRLASVRLILVGGGPGTGKSTVAEAVAQRIGAAWLRTDEVRKDLAGVAHNEHAFAAPDEGIYSPEMNAEVHEEMMRQAGALLRAGTSVVLDGTWRRADQRADLRAVAADASAATSELCCILDTAIAKERIARRMASIYNPSDASPELVDHIADRFDAWPEATPIDTAGTVAATIATACAAIEPVAVTAVPTTGRFALDLIERRNLVLISGGFDGK